MFVNSVGMLLLVTVLYLFWVGGCFAWFVYGVCSSRLLWVWFLWVDWLGLCLRSVACLMAHVGLLYDYFDVSGLCMV